MCIYIYVMYIYIECIYSVYVYIYMLIVHIACHIVGNIFYFFEFRLVVWLDTNSIKLVDPLWMRLAVAPHHFPC